MAEGVRVLTAEIGILALGLGEGRFAPGFVGKAKIGGDRFVAIHPNDDGVVGFGDISAPTDKRPAFRGNGIYLDVDTDEAVCSGERGLDAAETLGVVSLMSE